MGRHTARLPGQTLGDQSSGFIDTHQASTSKQACSGDSADINHGRDRVGWGAYFCLPGTHKLRQVPLPPGFKQESSFICDMRYPLALGKKRHLGLMEGNRRSMWQATADHSRSVSFQLLAKSYASNFA